MSHVRKQAFIDAPVEQIWELVSNVERHPQWWPRVLEVECDGLETGCTYRQVVQLPYGKSEMKLMVDDLEECRRLSIRCLSSGTFVRFGLTGAREGTFVDGEMGMDPHGIVDRTIDAVAGRRYFTSWMTQTFAALEQAAAGERQSAA